MSTPLIKRLSTSDGDFLPVLDKLIAWNSVSDIDVEQLVAKIIEQVCSQVVDLSLVRARAEMTNQSFLTTKQHTRVNEEMIERLPQPQLV